MLKKKIIALLCVLCCSLKITASACTLFAATGDNFVQGGGTLVAKNRDWYPGHQELKVVHPPHGYAYYGLFSGKSATFNAAGVNEKGLFVAMSTASSIPQKERRSYPVFKSTEGLRTNEYLLRYYASVDEVLAAQAIWSEPVNFIVADSKKVAYIEVAPGNAERGIRVETKGILFHTNHYVEDNTLEFNKKIGPSSSIRYDRVKDLLTNHDGKFTLPDFVTISQDQNDGPDHSLYRLGSKPTGVSTVANFIVYLPPVGSPLIYVKYRAEANEQGQEMVTGVENLDSLLNAKI